jgi:hypothetical protein
MFFKYLFVKSINPINKKIKMKKSLLLIAVIFAVFTMNAQYLIKGDDGNQFTDEMVFEFSEIGDPDGSLNFFVTNTELEDIHMRIQFVSAVNTDGSGFQMCFNLCYDDIDVGDSVPQVPNKVTIAAGETTGFGNHFLKYEEGTEIEDYNFRFHQTDSEGNDIGNNLNITYRYNPILGVEDVNELGISIASTVILNDMQVTAVEELNMEIYSLQGKLVNSQKLNIGQQLINMSNLSSQMYIVKFSNDEGASKTIKVVKK